MVSAPKVTAIIPTFRRPLFLKRALLSVLQQSYSHFVIQILDNASGDETGDIAKEFMKSDSRIRYYRHENNIGSLNNMIYGMQTVETEFFNILCDDDVLMPTFYEEALSLHESSEESLAFVCSRVAAVDERGQFTDLNQHTHPRNKCVLDPPDGIVRCIRGGVSLTGVVYRASAITSIGMPRDAWWNWTETGWHAIAAATYPIGCSPIVGGIFMNHSGGGSKKMDRAEFRLTWFKMIADVKVVATQTAKNESWWDRHMSPLVFKRFFGTSVRLCSSEGASMYDELGRLAVQVGLNRWMVICVVKVARVCQAIGIGSLVNLMLDGLQILFGYRSRNRSIVAFGQQRIEEPIVAASTEFNDLSQRAGIG